MVDSYLLKQEQIGGKVDAGIKSEEYNGPEVDPNGTIKMKIELVKSGDDDTLPSYLVPILDCKKDGLSDTKTTSSSVMVTLSGSNLLQVTDAGEIKKIKCEITSNFLNGKEKSAITIETYYQDSSSTIVKNTIYFDESLLKSYGSGRALNTATNPFTAVAAPGDSSSSDPPSYKFTFDFDTIITAIKALPAYQLIQSMFKVAYGVTDTSLQTACLVKISDGAFLNLNFTGVPFNTGNINKKSGASSLLLSISTTQATGIDGCDFTGILGDGVNLSENLKKVLELREYPIDCSKIPVPPSSKPQPGTSNDAAAEAAAKAAADADAAAADVGSISEEDKQAIGDSDIKDVIALAKELNEAKAKIPLDQGAIDSAQAALDDKLKTKGLMDKVEAVLKTSGLPQNVINAVTKVKKLVDAKNNVFAQAEKSAASSIKVSAPVTGAGVSSNELVALQQMIQDAISKYNESIAMLITQMNQLSQQGMGGSAQRQVIVQAPGTAGTCSTGDISLTTNNLDTLSVNIPIDKIMSYVIDPSMLAKYTSSNVQQQKPPNQKQPPQQQQPPPPNAQKQQQPQQLLQQQQQQLLQQQQNLQQQQQQQQPSVIELDQPKKNALQAAKGKLGELTQQLNVVGITTLPSEVEALRIAVDAAEQAVKDFESATADDDKNAKKPDAEGKIDTATRLVAAAVTAAQTATDAAPKPPVDENAAKIQGLKDKLSAAKQKFEAAKGKLAGITTDPKPVVDEKTANDTLAAADTAITAIGSATDAAKKPDLIKTAADAVNAAEAAVNQFSAKVDAAAKDVPLAEKESSGIPTEDIEKYKTAIKQINAATRAVDNIMSTSVDASKTASVIEVVKKANETAQVINSSTNDEILSAVQAIEGAISNESSIDFNNLKKLLGTLKLEVVKYIATKMYNNTTGKLNKAIESITAFSKSGNSNSIIPQVVTAVQAAKQYVDNITASTIPSLDTIPVNTSLNAVVDIIVSSESVKDISDSNFKPKTIEQVKSEDGGLNNLKQPVKQLREEVGKLLDAIKKIKPEEAYATSGDDAGKGDEAAKEQQEKETMQTYNTFYQEFKKCLVNGENSNKINLNEGENVRDNLLKCFTDNKFQDVDVSNFFNAVQAASLNRNAYKIGPSKFTSYNETNDGGNTNHELLLAIINSLATNEVNSDTDVNKTSFEELIKSLTDMLTTDESPLMKKIKVKYEKTPSAQGGGSKPNPKSKSSSSKSKSTPKNKTKKNHHSKSNPNPNKNKTPKIKMNE